MTQTSLTEQAPAKVNLTLRVVGRRPDGYHQLECLVAFASDVRDSVDVLSGTSKCIQFAGPFASPDLQVRPDQTTVGAAVRSLSQSGLSFDFERATIEKRIPLAAGLGGGSADAAAVLRLARRLSPERESDVDWQRLALGIGADVPACLLSKACMMAGMGERIEPVRSFPRCFLVLVNPAQAVLENKTAQVFQRLASQPLAGNSIEPSDPPRLSSFADLAVYVAGNTNDLEGAASEFMTTIPTIKMAVASQPGCRVARMTGAGPTVFGLFEAEADAQAATASLRKHQPDWWVEVTALQ